MFSGPAGISNDFDGFRSRLVFNSFSSQIPEHFEPPNVWPPGEPVPSNQHPVLTFGLEFWDPGSDERKQASDSPFTSLPP